MIHIIANRYSADSFRKHKALTAEAYVNKAYKFFILSRILVVLSLLLFTFLNLTYAQEPPKESPSPQIEGQAATISGVFTIDWGNSIDGKSVIIYTLTDVTGRRTALQLDDKVSRKLGGVLLLNGKHVTVQGTWSTPSKIVMTPDLRQSPPAVLKVDSISLALSPESRASTAKDIIALGVSGSHPWITIMCKFSDIAAEPHDRAYFQGMYGDTRPGLNHYWKEVSFNTFDITGSTVGGTGWYTLPHTELYYNPTDTQMGADKTAVMMDCISAADADVDFSLYDGINMMFNSDYDNGWAWGGGTGLITLDGVTRNWRKTLEPPWGYANISVIAHEMGHGFGLPHSTAIDWTAVYDNAWDVMSWDRYNCAAATDPTYGCIPQHTISYHKDLLGVIPEPQKMTVATGTSATVILEDLAAPASTNYQMVKIPIKGSATNFYTVEARRHNGYDAKLPGEAVIIHNVDKAQGAVLVPTTLSADDPGVMWTVDETFTDDTNYIQVKVNSATVTGFEVTISNGLKIIKPPYEEAVCQGWCPIWVNPWWWVTNPIVLWSLVVLPVLTWAIGKNFGPTYQTNKGRTIVAATGFAVVAVGGPIGGWIVIGATALAGGAAVVRQTASGQR
jgi:M6 family metalloprotease-like protein